MRKLDTPNHKLYEEYYLNQAKKKGGNLPAFHGARFQQGYGLGSVFKGLFRWAMPHLQQGAKVLGKKASQTGAQVAQDVLEGNNVNTALAKRSKEAIGGLVSQAGRCRKATKRKVQFRGLPPFKKRKTKTNTTFNFGRKFKWDSLKKL